MREMIYLMLSEDDEINVFVFRLEKKVEVFVVQEKIYFTEFEVGSEKVEWQINSVDKHDEIVSLFKRLDETIYVCEEGCFHSLHAEESKFSTPLHKLKISSSYSIPSGLATVGVDENGMNYEINFYLWTHANPFFTWSPEPSSGSNNSDLKPVLICCRRQGDDSIDESHRSSIILESNFYNSLFGSTLLGFICAFPDGRVFSLPFSSFPDGKSDAKLLCCLPDAVLEIFPLKNSDNSTYSICIISICGRVFFVKSSIENPSCLLIEDEFLSKNITSCDIVRDILFYSTDEVVHQVDLSRQPRNPPNMCWQIGGVTRLKVISLPSDNTIVLLLITRDGRVFDFTADLESMNESTIDLTLVSRSISDLFSRLNQLNVQENDLRSVLRSLSSISTLLGSKTDVFNLSCRFLRFRNILQIEITNISHVNLLSPCLVLFVIITWPCYSFEESNNQSQFIKCQPLLSDLKTGDSITVDINLPQDALFNFPLLVTSSLIAVVEEKFGRAENKTLVPLAHIYQKQITVDELHLLHLRDQFDIPTEKSLKEKIWSLAEKKEAFHRLFQINPLQSSIKFSSFPNMTSINVVVNDDFDLMDFILKDSQHYVKTSDLNKQICCNGKEIRFEVHKEDLMQILNIYCNDFDMLFKLRSAICSRLQNFPVNRCNLSTISLSPMIYVSHSDTSRMLADFYNRDLVSQIRCLISVFCQLRTSVSSKLPSACLL